MLKKIKTKILSAQYFFNSLVLNILGIQIIRYICAHLIYYYKFKKLHLNNDSNLEILKKKGYVKFENFIKDDELKYIKDEFEKLIKSKYAKNVQSENEGTENIVVFTNDELLKDYKYLNSIINDARIKKLFCGSEIKDNVKISCRLERIYCKNNSLEDINKNFHYDTFHNTFKAWLYLSDSNLKNGPLNIIEGSNRFSLKKLFYIYIHSISYSFNKFFNKNKDFQLFRFYNKKSLSKKSINLIASQKDFLLANTHAIHRRGDASENSIRDALHFYSRENPFY